MNLKKILAVVLSMTLLVSCLVSGMSLNTSAEENNTTAQNDAKAKLEAAWNQLYYNPVVALQGFYQKNTNVWEMRESASKDFVEIEGLQVPYYTFTTAKDTKGAFILSGIDNNIYNPNNTSNYITEGSRVYFYVKHESTQNDIGNYRITSANNNDSHYGSKTAENVTGDNSATWRKYTLTINGWSNKAAYLGRVQFDYDKTILDNKISAAVYEEKLVVPTYNTLLELIKAADNLDLNEIKDGEAKNDFVTALAKAKTAYYSDENNAKNAIIAAWKNVKHKREIIFDTFTYKDENKAWNVIDADIVVDANNTVTYKKTTVNEEDVTVVENVGKLSASGPGFILINNSFANKNGDGTIDVSKPKNESAMFDIYDYEEAYLYYSTKESISINLASTQLNTGFGGATRGEVYVTLNENSENGDYKKLDLFAKFNAIEDNAQHSSYGTTATLDRNIKGENETNDQIGSALSRAHIGSVYTSLHGISYLYGVKKVKFSEEFGDVFKEVPLEDTIEGTLAYAKGLKYEADENKTLADWMEAYTKYEAALKNNYNAAELVAVVEDVKAANPAVRISGDAIWSENNLCFYDNGNSTLATAYRTYAQYTCPIENGNPVLNKVVVDGKAYDLVSRSILIARSADGTFGTLDMSTVDAKWVTTTSEDLSAKYWSVADNGDGTATVTYSMLLKGVSQENAESKYHMTRAMIEYKDGAGNTVQVYSKPREHGKIKDTFDYAYGNNKNLQWFPSENN